MFCRFMWDFGIEVVVGIVECMEYIGFWIIIGCCWDIVGWVEGVFGVNVLVFGLSLNFCIYELW